MVSLITSPKISDSFYISFSNWIPPVRERTSCKMLVGMSQVCHLELNARGSLPCGESSSGI